MELFYYQEPRPNFGDDLNAHLWPRLLSPEMYAVEDLVVVGIGSILTEEWLGRFGDAGKRVVVLGSGTSYDRPPRRVGEWSVLAVRGPWTAAMIGMPDTAVTDGAILLADTPDLVGPPQERRDVVFMPHHRSVRRTPWEEVAAEAGMRFVSPQQPVEEVLAAFARARLVVTEAMHGAIVADTLRIPWVPVTVSPTVDEFKWRDWCLSMEVPYDPVTVPAGDVRDDRRYRRMRAVLAGQGLTGHRNLLDAVAPTDLERYFERRFSTATKTAILDADRGTTATRATGLLARPLNGFQHRRAVAALRAAAERRPVLSSTVQFERRLDQMRAAVGRAEDIALHG